MKKKTWFVNCIIISALRRLRARLFKKMQILDGGLCMAGKFSYTTAAKTVKNILLIFLI